MSPTTAMSACPDAETLGMFNDGLLTGAELDAVTRHVATCDECLEAVAMASAVKRAGIATADDSSVAARVPVRRSLPTWLAIAAALVVAVIGVAIWQQRQSTAGMRTLIAAAPSDYRLVEPRLSGFPWAPLSQKRSEASNEDAAFLRLAGAAGEVLARGQHDDSTNAKHAAGVADVLLRRNANAIDALEKASRESTDAAVWNDLGAARYNESIRQPSLLPAALAAADKAIQLAPRSAEGHFNRALILTRMGSRERAAAAWRDYLAIDSTSPWADEARRRLAALDGAKDGAKDGAAP